MFLFVSSSIVLSPPSRLLNMLDTQTVSGGAGGAGGGGYPEQVSAEFLNVSHSSAHRACRLSFITFNV
jgi:hypothetical protein